MDLWCLDVLASRMRLHRGRLFRRPDRPLRRFLVAPAATIQGYGYAVQPGLVPTARAPLRKAASLVPPDLRPTSSADVRRRPRGWILHPLAASQGGVTGTVLTCPPVS